MAAVPMPPFIAPLHPQHLADGGPGARADSAFFDRAGRRAEAAA